MIRTWIAVTALVFAMTSNASAVELTDLLKPASPGHFDTTLFAGGYGSEVYGATHEGMELEQSLTRGIGATLRLSGYQLYNGSGFDNPIRPAPGRTTPFFFGRIAGGVDVSPWNGTHLLVLGGRDFGDSTSSSISAELSAWTAPISRHPINLSFGFNHYYENDVTNGLIDLRTICLSTGAMLLLAGAGSTIWGGGSAQGPKVQVGPDLGIFLRRSQVRLDLQTGYGSDHLYGILSLSRRFDWEE